MGAEMDVVGVFEAKAQLSMLLERVARGEKITISKRGVPVAILSPVNETEALAKRKAVIARIKKFRKGRTLDGLDIKSLIHEGHKY